MKPQAGLSSAASWQLGAGREVCVCVCVCVCVQEREKGCVCVCVQEREKGCVCIYVCIGERERGDVYTGESVCACVCAHQRPGPSTKPRAAWWDSDIDPWCGGTNLVRTST